MVSMYMGFYPTGSEPIDRYREVKLC